MGKKFIFLLFFFLLFLFDINPQNNFWEKISGPFGGRIYSLTKDPIGNIFCGTTRGIFKTENFGENWFSYSFKPDQVQDFIYINDDSLLVLSFPNTYKSTDGGITWDSLLSSDGIKKIYSNNGYIILGAEDYTVMISNDFGENWDVKRVKEYSWPFTPEPIISLLMVNDSTILSGSLGDGLFISTDKGFTWNNKILYENIYCLLSYNSVIYAGTSSGIYFSSDSGLSWNNLGMTNKAIYCIEIKNNLMLASTNKEILRSTNSGCNWEQFLPNELINKINDITINDAGKIFIASDIGIFSSIDLGETWISQNQGVESINNFFSILAFDNHIFVGTFDGIYASSDNGINWEYRSKGIYQKIVYSIIKKGHDLFAGTINGLFKSIDLGVSWIVCELDTFWVRGLATDSYDNIFAGTNNGIFKSTDDGDSWTNITSFNAGGFNSFIVLPNNYIFTGNHYSTNSGDSWYEINILNASTITNYKNELYAGTDMSGVYYSSDLGNTWESRGLNNLEIFSLSVNNDTVLVGINNAGNDPNPVGPYISFNKGSTWNDVGEGMENKSVLSFEFDEKGYLLAGTRTCLYRSKNILTSFLEGQVRKTETKYILSQNYPNPFNPVTRIRYQLPERTFVSIKVYDNLGKEIALLVNEEKTAGEYSIEFDGSEFSSGVYFYSIAAGDFREVRKIILMK